MKENDDRILIKGYVWPNSCTQKIVIVQFQLARVFNCSTDSSLQQADFLRECVMVRDGLFTLPNWFLISDIDAIIDCMCCD